MPTIAAGDLIVDYAEYGRPRDPALLLIHGWPDDASTWDRIAPALARAGHRVIVPTLRGFGATRFADAAAPRTANSAMLALDMIVLMDALGIGRFAVAGHDWGSNTAEAIAVGWPGRVTRLAMMSTPPRLGGLETPPFEQAQRYWYHWFMATARGAAAVAADRRGFTHRHWINWAPKGWFSEATFAKVAKSFDNPDWVAVTLHSYRSRWDEVAPDPRSVWLEQKVKATKTLDLPTLFIKGDADGVTTQAAFDKVPAKFGGEFEMVGLKRVGHFPTREAPAKVAKLLKKFFAR